MTISNMIGPVEEMSLADHPISGLYFFGAGFPEVFFSLLLIFKNIKLDFV